MRAFRFDVTILYHCSIIIMNISQFQKLGLMLGLGLPLMAALVSAYSGNIMQIGDHKVLHRSCCSQ